MLLKVKSQNLINYFVSFLLITVDSSFFLVNNVDGYVRILIIIFATLLLIRKTIKLNKEMLIIIIFLLFGVFFNGLLFSNTKQTLIIIISLISSYCYVSRIEKKEFTLIYNKIIYFLSVFSLFLLFLYIIVPPIIRLLPTIPKESDFSYYNAIFTVIADNSYVTRNYGFFWEPGAFSIFVNIALYFELFVGESLKLKKIIVYIITIISTLSTLGISCMIILLATQLNKRMFKQNMKKLRFLLSFILISGVIFLILYGDWFSYHVFGKLNIVGGLSSTTSTRLDSIIYPFFGFMKSPILGLGMNEFMFIQEVYCNNMATFTFLNWLATYGFIIGGLFIYGVMNFFSVNRTKIMNKILIIMFSILLFSTENFMLITFIYILVFYGFKDKISIGRGS